ncbi:MAG: hypothetical protein A2745_03700 [Candidatus Harrisonbacteria bacterium RIFCSPHIGHO2_01_FULL_44_13]|uniref:Uncharacterized protein n=1 Tax=Candidatus Harrisonbacteria bacterium RIFCSPLOWO2_01_FULL_44_18 TaxID=1798407 RepID=A0A1G1ZP52_9BACT|nr:MAG: hypothetical protein A2745_03700 [Candidatus Harrisonbacteria bacterium RIFCSPHIGHO2_01_FULL_44_13]OGY66285.1 MAG: hypothetical protein A3A16_00020 [Candidatus Harrisonbacteria bacterium RIFCSPLOWO2_01_FULL_44_18]
MSPDKSQKLLILVAVVLAAFWFFLIQNPAFLIKPAKVEKEIVVKKTIPAGATFDQLAKEAGVATNTTAAILESAKDAYDLAKIVSGRELALVYDKISGGLKRLVYQIDSEKELIIERAQGDSPSEPLSEPVRQTHDKPLDSAQGEPVWQARVLLIPYEIKQSEAGGIIASSLFETIQSAGLDIRLALALAEMFAWQIDFAADIREGDSFKVIYEQRFLNDEYAMPGKILAAEFINDKKIFRGFYFDGGQTKAGLPTRVSTKAGYYDENGNSLQKVFLKSPLQYKYISSGFTYARLNPITKEISPHRGIDYAANAGTPAVSVGDGTVIQAGWNGYYGISATIRHNETYKTVYGHFASLAKGIKIGAKVKQGQVIGYVGSTGQATGPHLHYEMHKFNQYANPFNVEIPPGEPISEADRLSFEKIKSEYLEELTRTASI